MSISHMILKQLDELKEEDFERFRFFMTGNTARGFKPIPRSKLEKASRPTLVEEMVKRYGEQKAACITVQILRQNEKNTLANNLEKQLAEACPDVGGASSSSSSSSSSCQAAGVSQNISSAGTSNVYSPVLSGGTYNGPVTMNFSSTPNN